MNVFHLLNTPRAARICMSLGASVLVLAMALTGVVHHNLTTLHGFEKCLENHERKANRAIEDALSGASVALNRPEDAPPPVDAPLDWSEVSTKVMPSVVTVSHRRLPYDPNTSSAWKLPGVWKNSLTQAMGAVVGWQDDIDELNKKIEFNTIGAGFLVGDGTRVLTAAHVIDAAGEYRVRVAEGQWRKATVVGLDVTADVGLLAIEGRAGPAVAVAPVLPRQGSPVMTIGAPGGMGFSVSTGIVSRWAEGTFFKTARFLQIDASVIGGNSGGVVVDRNGAAVGIISHGYGLFTQAIPIDRAMVVAQKFPSSRFLVAETSAAARGNDIPCAAAQQGGLCRTSFHGSGPR